MILFSKIPCRFSLQDSQQVLKQLVAGARCSSASAVAEPPQRVRSESASSVLADRLGKLENASQVSHGSQDLFVTLWPT